MNTRLFHAFLFLAACLGAAILAIALACATLLLDGQQLTRQVVNAFETGALTEASYLGNDSRRGRYTVNDCLILQSLLVGRDDWKKIGLRSTILLVPDQSPCTTLKNFAEKKLAAQAVSAYEYSYGRYFFAAKAFTGFGLAVTSLENLRHILRSTIYLLLGTTLIASVLGLVRGGKHQSSLYAATAIFSICWLFFYDLWYYSPTLAHGFSEISLAAFMVYTVLAEPPKSRRGIFIPAIILFFATAWFELLTGPSLIAIALAVMVGLAHRVTDPNAVKSAIEMWALGIASIAGCFLSLILFNVSTGDTDSLSKFVKHLALRVNLLAYVDFEIDDRWRFAQNTQNYSAFQVWDSIVGHLPMLTYSFKTVSNVTFGLSAAILGVTTAVGILMPPFRFLLVLSSIAIGVICWYFIFANHTVIHAWGMVRMMVLLPAAAAFAITLVVLKRRSGLRTSSHRRIISN